MPHTIFSFFGLRENPFRINPDPRFLFITDQARAAADELAYAIRTRKGLILLTGEVGTGKTMLIRRLLDWLAEQKMPTALIFNSHIKPEELLDFILNDFGVPCASTLKSEKLIALNGWLLERYRAGQTPVLIVDEAQGLEPTALEEIRLLLNFETPREKLLQIVLAGQPELEIKLKRHELRQLRQRITIRCRTAPLTLEQTHAYIRERLRVAGGSDDSIFEPGAASSVHAYSRGIPRVINVLCEHSLINACADGASTISPATVERAARDWQLDRTDSIARILTRAPTLRRASRISALYSPPFPPGQTPSLGHQPSSNSQKDFLLLPGIAITMCSLCPLRGQPPTLRSQRIHGKRTRLRMSSRWEPPRHVMTKSHSRQIKTLQCKRDQRLFRRLGLRPVARQSISCVSGAGASPPMHAPPRASSAAPCIPLESVGGNLSSAICAAS